MDALTEKIKDADTQREYWRWSVKKKEMKEREMPFQEPKQWLQDLSKVDFSDKMAVCYLSNGLSNRGLLNLILAFDDDNVFIVRPGSCALVIHEDTPTNVDIHPVFVSLSSGNDKAIHSSFPSFGMVVGQVVRKPIRCYGKIKSSYLRRDPKKYWSDRTLSRLLRLIEVDPDDLEETNYVVVIDAINPRHPVWLVYSRYQSVYYDEEPPIDPNDQRVVFTEIGTNFDAAQILPEAKLWMDSYGKLKFDAIKDNIKNTRIMGAVMARDAEMKDVTAAFEREHLYV